MDRAEAARRLGVPADATVEEARRAYRRLIRARHPDQAGPAAGPEAAAIIAAWEVLRDDPVAASVPTAPAVGADLGSGLVSAEGDTLGIALPAEEAFLVLVDCAHDLGEVTYVDPEAGLFQAVVELFDGTCCSLVVSLQGRADRVEAFCTVDRLDGGPPFEAAAIARLLAETADRHLAEAG